MSSRSKFSFVLVGVGGQGTLLASNILAEVGLAAGFDVKKSEVHGMAQRGGSVASHVRWDSERVFSPLVGLGEADVLLSFEKMEALRFAHLLRRGGTAVVNDMAIVPVTVSSGSSAYPGDEHLARVFAALDARLVMVPGEALAQDAGNVKAANVVLLGAVSCLLPLPEEAWWACIAQRVPKKFLDLNHAAFALGRANAGAGAPIGA
ncbi:MAG: indolepyruvate oxidoreductase subunit beta [Thermoanaerobaculaceae bacterium]|nr:indolepyruvate oxidoreductase subunit beta [Thermoanaerobaculaceae bacterium]TAM48796.1 MAG: indolepyruvate oxidoreductase subunit beta [Acidobacteriota bacterium]